MVPVAIFAGAALAGWFVQSQTLFYSPSTWLQHMLLLGFLIPMRGSETARATGHLWQLERVPDPHEG